MSAGVVALLVLAQAPAGPDRTLNDRYPPPHYTALADWERRATFLREHELASAGLLPLPLKAPLGAVVFDELRHADYSASKVYFESLPGFYVTGNLYRPMGNGPFPAVPSPHGHWTYGRSEWVNRGDRDSRWLCAGRRVGRRTRVCAMIRTSPLSASLLKREWRRFLRLILLPSVIEGQVVAVTTRSAPIDRGSPSTF